MKKAVIDCKKVKTKEAFHHMIARKLDFPEYYGHNLDALWDCLTELKEVRIKLINSNYLEYNLGEYGEKLLNLFEDLVMESEDYRVGLY